MSTFRFVLFIYATLSFSNECYYLFSKKLSDFYEDTVLFNKKIDTVKNDLAKAFNDKSSSLDEKINLLVNMEKILSRRVWALRSTGAAKDEVLKYLKNLTTSNNTLTKYYEELLKQHNFPFKIKTKNYAQNKISFDILVLEDAISSSDKVSVKKIIEYKKRFGTNEVTISPFENTLHGSAGFSMASEKRIDIGTDGAVNMLRYDEITMVGKHEFKHADFASNRVKKENSIFHTQYSSRDGKELTDVDTSYSTYMSAEELYTFANNPFWASHKLLDISKYNYSEYMADLKKISNYLKSGSKVAKQTYILSNEAIDGLEALIRSTKENGQARFQLSNSFGEPIPFLTDKDDAFWLSFLDKKETKFIRMFVQTEDLGDFLIKKENLNNRLMKKYKELGSKGFALSPQEQMMIQVFEKDGLMELKESQIDFFERLIKKQKTLSRVARKFEVLNEKIIKETDDFMSKQAIKIGLDKDYLKTKKASDDFIDLRKRYRLLGVSVRENYKGFLGK